jgi:hypothetical protein
MERLTTTFVLNRVRSEGIHNLAAKFMDRKLKQYLASIGSRGGKKRAALYDKKTLSEWAKKGGRPKKEQAK